MACHKLRQAASQRISSRFLNAVCYAVGIFLIPDVLSYHGFVYPDRADIISACPECLISPSPSPPLRMSVVKHHRTLSFQHTHHLGHRVFRRYPYADMYVVYTDRSLHQLQLIHLKQPLYDVPDFCTAFPVQDFFSIFWYKYYVVCTIPLCMCRTFLLHFFVSCVLVRDALLPLLHFITGDFFLLNYCPCKTHCRTTGRACGFLLVLKCNESLVSDLAVVYPSRISEAMKKELMNLNIGDYFEALVVGRSSWYYVDVPVWNSNGTYRTEP